MVFDKVIKIQKCNEEEQWEDFLSPLYARINKSGSSNNEYMSSGSERSRATKVFELRYVDMLKVIQFNTQSFRIVYENYNYNIVDYDDYLEKHQTIKLLGESY